MMKLAVALRALSNDRQGVTALEYGLIASIIFGLILLGFQTLGGSLANEFSSIGAGL